MTGSGSPCGACKFLRRCENGCVFAPFFCHKEGAAQFSPIHKVFGASNVSKLLSHLPESDRCKAAVTISYEAQARLQDPVYGCVSQILTPQQQVVSLQEHLASRKEHAATQSYLIIGILSANPNEKFYELNPSSSDPQDAQGWLQLDNSDMVPLFNPSSSADSMPMPYYEFGFQLDNSDMVPLFNLSCSTSSMPMPYYEAGFMDPPAMGTYENSTIPEANVSFDSFEEAGRYTSTMDSKYPPSAVMKIGVHDFVKY